MSLSEPESDECDFALIGAGCAGLSLAVQLSDAFPDRRVVLLDPGLGDLANRTFAFWSEREPPLPEAISQSWSRVRVVTESRAAERPCFMPAVS